MPHAPWWRPIVRFAGHMAAGSIIFVMMASVSFGLSQVVHWLEQVGAPSFHVTVLGFVEEAILAIDAGLFLLYLLVEGWKAMREIWDERGDA